MARSRPRYTSGIMISKTQLSTPRRSAKPARANAASVEADPRWQAILQRDATRDGQFYFSVRSTGVYCRPSCSARHPNPENVTIHATLADAERAGFRACRRCRPGEPSLAQTQSALITQLCREMEQHEERLPLSELAERAGLSVYHFHRVFKQQTGMTPMQFARAARAQRMRAALREEQSVTRAIQRAGFSSSSRFYENSTRELGMTPASRRTGAAREQIQYAFANCSLGTLLVASTAIGICHISIGDTRETLLQELTREFPKASLSEGSFDWQETVRALTLQIEQGSLESGLSLDVRGTVFQMKVWRAIQQIREGETCTYTELARRVGTPGSVRAVARACASNRIAVAIPCHRVVRSDGSLAGYRWGIERKDILQKREAAARERIVTKVKINKNNNQK